MANLKFKITGEWNLQGSNKKKLYISFVTKIDDWKKNVIFYQASIGKEAFAFLFQFTEGEPRVGWTFSVITGGRYMNSLFVNQILWVKDQAGNVVFTGENV